MFAFIQGWSETYGVVQRADFDGLDEIDRFPGSYGETILLFERR